jgi:hypothetical protein
VAKTTLFYMEFDSGIMSFLQSDSVVDVGRMLAQDQL